MALQVSRVLHATYVFKSEKAQIIFDPIFFRVFSGNCHAFPDVEFDYQALAQQHFDAVFISHFHEDHCSLKSLNLLDRKTKIFLYCVYDELFQLIRSLGFSDVSSLQIGDTVRVEDFTVTTKLALDSDVDSIFHIQYHNMNILNVVDSWIDPSTMASLQRQKSWDLVLWPFQTMRELEVIQISRSQASDRRIPNECLQDLIELSPSILIPSSCQFRFEAWSWYNQSFFPISYQNFHAQISQSLPSTKVIRLDPSKTLLLDRDLDGTCSVKIGPSLDWVKLLETDSPDYEYDSDLIPPKTLLVAQHFEDLTEEQRNLVLEFCKIKMPMIFASLPLMCEANFFDVDRVWRLSLHFKDKIEISFYYQVCQQQMIFLGNEYSHFEWLTEIPATKLFGALFKGESLTSIYLRLNDCIFASEIEAQLAVADPLSDPLIRSLYTNSFASYQKYELECINGRG